jgi:N-acetylmuramoyl-L-alanine amidase
MTLDVIFDVQHQSKITRPRDRGAIFENYKESDLVFNYVLKATKYLYENTVHNTFIMSYGNYYTRHWLVNKHNPSVYLACHLNSCLNGVGKYSLVEYLTSQAENENTKKLAELFSDNFKELLPVEKSIIKVINNNNRGHYCLKNVKCPAVILEPLFINNPEHLDFILNNDYKIAGAIAKSVLEYGKYLEEANE